MAFLTKNQRLLGPKMTKRLGFSVDYGTAFFGFTEFGRENEFAGIYQKYYTLKGIQQVHKLMYWPTNPQSVPQQANRSIFASGVSAWQALSAPDKKIYNDRAYRLKIGGYHLFLREWMHSH